MNVILDCHPHPHPQRPMGKPGRRRKVKSKRGTSHHRVQRSEVRAERLFLLGTWCLVRKASLSEEKPLPFGQRVRRPRKNGLRLIAIFNMADDMGRYGVLSEIEIEKYSVRKEKKAVQIGFTKVALGKFIDQMTWICILYGKMYEG